MLNRDARLLLLAGALAVGCGDEDRPPPRPKPGTFSPSGIQLAPAADYVHTVALGDVDADGWLDVAVSPGADNTLLSRNTGGGFVEVPSVLPNVGFGWLAWGDYDGDRLLDIFLAGNTSVSAAAEIWHNEGSFSFAKLLPELVASGVSDPAACWGDYDNDGDLDIAIAGQTGPPSMARGTWLFRNEGGAFAEVAFAVEDMDMAALAWGDYDNDGDLDIAVAGWPVSGQICAVYANDSGVFTDISAGLTAVVSAGLAWGDYDSDGDLDLVAAGQQVGVGLVATVYENDGAGGFTDINAGLGGTVSGTVSWGDYDNDGDLDLLIGVWPAVYRNDGGGVFVDLGLDIPSVGGQAAWGDYDDDGDLDFALAGYKQVEPPFYSPDDIRICTFYRNNVNVPNTLPDTPAGLSAVVSGAGPVYDVAFSWDASTDVETPTPGLTYNMRVADFSTGIEQMPGMSIVGGPNDGKRMIPAMGNVQHAGPPAAPKRTWTLHLPTGDYVWSVQAVDTAFAGSPWAAEETLTVP